MFYGTHLRRKKEIQVLISSLLLTDLKKLSDEMTKFCVFLLTLLSQGRELRFSLGINTFNGINISTIEISFSSILMPSLP
jgi:hypothetical protein